MQKTNKSPGAGGTARGAAATIASSDYGCHNTAPAGQSKAPGQVPIHAETASIALSEDALACTFAQRHGDKFKYVYMTSPRRWFVLDANSGEWEADVTLLHLDRIRSICREAAAGCDDPHLARELCSARTMIAVEQLARSDRRLAATREGVGLPVKTRRAAPKTGRKRTIAGTEAIAAETDIVAAETTISAETDAGSAETTAADAIIARARRAGEP